MGRSVSDPVLLNRNVFSSLKSKSEYHTFGTSSIDGSNIQGMAKNASVRIETTERETKLL